MPIHPPQELGDFIKAGALQWAPAFLVTHLLVHAAHPEMNCSVFPLRFKQNKA